MLNPLITKFFTMIGKFVLRLIPITMSFVSVLFQEEVTAQSRLAVNINFQYDTLTLRRYVFDKELDTAIKTVVVKLKFDGTQILNPKDLEVLNGGLARVLSVDYVFTEDTNIVRQNQLNKRRIFELGLLCPDLLAPKMTKWKFIRQTEFYKNGDAQKLFHGFVIRYTKAVNYDADPKRIKEDILSREKRVADSTVLKIFTRNSSFNADVIVADLTGSMSPYYLEILAWFSLNETDKERSYSFFNDGDHKPTEEKVIGKTGGIYQVKSKSLDTIVEYVRQTIQSGNGGDQPENNIEAILKAIEKNPACKEVIMLADNWSDMRDYNLRYQVNKPVRIILCGTKQGINPQYLNLAYITKGSVHTIEEDLDKLFELKNGATFILAGQTFVVSNGNIVPLAKP